MEMNYFPALHFFLFILSFLRFALCVMHAQCQKQNTDKCNAYESIQWMRFVRCCTAEQRAAAVALLLCPAVLALLHEPLLAA
jgi:hypothetical protein